MKKLGFIIFMSVICLGLSVGRAYSHCEIPCGIYDDQMRVKMMREHIATIEKSMQEIINLSADKNKDYNQLVRWVDNKEQHAQYLQQIVAQYFLTQRIKPTETKDVFKRQVYLEELTVLHKIMVEAMKAKQTTSPAVIITLRQLVDRFETIYFK